MVSESENKRGQKKIIQRISKPIGNRNGEEK
jgi:hypothetical protein